MMPSRTLKVLLLLASTISLQALADIDIATESCVAEGTCAEDTFREKEEFDDDDEDDNDDDDEDYEDDDDEDDECLDTYTDCVFWADEGDCTANLYFMSEKCKQSCGLCDDDFLREFRAKDLGVAQTLIGQDGTKTVDVQWVIQKARNYMLKVVPEDFEEGMPSICRNTHEMCSIWAMQGECDDNPAYMLPNCAPVCGSCEALTVEGRCPIDENAINAWGPGDLNKMFEKLTAEPYLSKYSVEILSSPEKGGPWVITMENVVSEVEAARLIELGGVEGYERSSDVGPMRPDGTFEKSFSDGRTSTNAWCTDDCWEDPVGRAVSYRLSNLTDIADENAENLQLLRYEVGQFYNIHHDYIPMHYNRQQGVRMLTAYLYLSDVEAGGGTNFDLLDITVMPKIGRVLLWPSVLDEDPQEKDWRTSHQALPVEAGVKFGANSWYHIRDFKTPNGNNCS